MLVRGQRDQGENVCKSLSCDFPGKEQARQGKQAGLNNFSGLWGTGAVPSCLVPGPGVIRMGEWWPGVREPTRGGGWGAGSGLVGLRVKGLLELFTVSGNELDLGGVVPVVSVRPRRSKHQNETVSQTRQTRTCGHRISERSLSSVPTPTTPLGTASRPTGLPGALLPLSTLGKPLIPLQPSMLRPGGANLRLQILTGLSDE